MNLRRQVNWTSVSVILSLKSWEEEVIALNTLAKEIHPKKSKSSIWERTEPAPVVKYQRGTTSFDAGPYAYEVLMPNLSEHHKLILEDLGYQVKESSMSRMTRRTYYKPLKL